jgi:hypothetical protein
MEVLTRAGFDTMDSHSADDAVLWHRLPDWNGSWGLLLLPQHIDFADSHRLYGIDGTYQFKLWER